jgi:hypothetical protein
MARYIFHRRPAQSGDLSALLDSYFRRRGEATVPCIVCDKDAEAISIVGSGVQCSCANCTTHFILPRSDH